MISYADFTLPRVEKARNARILEPLHLDSGPGQAVNGMEVHIYEVRDQEVQSLKPFIYSVSLCPDMMLIGCTCKPHRDTYVTCPHIAEVLYLLWSYRRFEMLPYQMRTVAQPPNLFNDFKATVTKLTTELLTGEDALVQEQATDILRLEIVTRGSRPARAAEIKRDLVALRAKYNDPNWRAHHGMQGEKN